MLRNVCTTAFCFILWLKISKQGIQCSASCTMRLLRAAPARQHFSLFGVYVYYAKAVNLFIFITQLNSRKAKNCVYVMISTNCEKMAKTRVHHFFICLGDACQFPVMMCHSQIHWMVNFVSFKTRKNAP